MAPLQYQTPMRTGTIIFFLECITIGGLADESASGAEREEISEEIAEVGGEEQVEDPPGC